jgi:hypothetical protein
VENSKKDELTPKKPAGIFGFLARLRDSGALARMPASWCKVMIALYGHRNTQGFAWPGQRTLAKEAGVSMRSVQKFIQWGKACLGIRIVREKSNLYYLPLDEKVDAWMPSFKNPVPKPNPQHTK